MVNIPDVTLLKKTDSTQSSVKCQYPLISDGILCHFPLYDRVLELVQVLDTLSEFICAITPQVSENTASLMLLTPSVSYHLYSLSSSKICELFGGGI